MLKQEDLNSFPIVFWESNMIGKPKKVINKYNNNFNVYQRLLIPDFKNEPKWTFSIPLQAIHKDKNIDKRYYAYLLKNKRYECSKRLKNENGEFYYEAFYLFGDEIYDAFKRFEDENNKRKALNGY